MKKLITLSFIMLFFISCAPNLKQRFYKNPNDIVFQHWACFLPKGYGQGMASPNYPGVLAIVKDELIFDAQGSGSRPWMPHLRSFIIMKPMVNDVTISEKKALGRNVISIITDTEEYQFYLAGGDKIFASILEWYK